MKPKNKQKMWYLNIVIFLSVAYCMICLVLYVYQEKLIFFPQKLLADYKFHFTQNFEEVWVENKAEDEILHALWFKSKNKLSKQVVLYFHGNGGSLEGWGSVAKDFTMLGYDVFMIDYRGYGKSRGKISQKILFKDAQKALQFVKKHYAEQNITLLGRSIGTGIASELATTCGAKRLILETPYYNFPSLVQYHVPFLPTSWLLRYSFRSDLFLPKITCPVYIFHGTDDATIPYKFGQKLAATIPKDRFITITAGNHNNLADYPLYHAKMKAILSEE